MLSYLWYRHRAGVSHGSLVSTHSIKTMNAHLHGVVALPSQCQRRRGVPCRSGAWSWTEGSRG